jgi:hypothetical protein
MRSAVAKHGNFRQCGSTALPRKVIHQSLIASCYLPFTIRYSPFATRCRFGSAGALPSQFIPPLVPRPVFKSVATKTKPAKEG